MIGAEILTQAMVESGTSVVFSLSGNQIMPIYDACLEPGIRIVHVRHESAAVFMADAYAQIVNAQIDNVQKPDAQKPDAQKPGAQKPDVQKSGAQIQDARSAGARVSASCGVALVTAGPGFANALGGLYSALMAESPVVLISGDSAVAQDGKRAFQEVSQTTASAPFVKHATRVTDVNEVASAWRECIAIATSGRPGPVHLAVPFDVLLAEASDSSIASSDLQSGTADTVSADTSQADRDPSAIISALLAAKKPLVLTGPAMTPSRMPQRLHRLQKELGLPVIAMESPRGLADPSLGNLAAVIHQADCLLLLGKLPDFTVGFANSAKVPAQTLIVVDADERSLQQSVSVLADRTQVEQGGIMAVHDNPVALADALCSQTIRSAEHTHWLDYAKQQLTVVPEVPSARVQPVQDAALTDQATLLTPQQIGNQVQQAVDQCEHSILVCDGGEFGQWAQACVRSELRVINGPSGAIGGSIPQAVAAKIANPRCVVFAMLGDGTAGFHLTELETSVREQAPIIVIIGNDSRWNAEYQIQLRDYGADRLHSCELGANVRYDLAAAGLGCAGAMVHTEAELTDALSAAVTRSRKQGQSSCINVSMAGWPAPVFE